MILAAKFKSHTEKAEHDAYTLEKIPLSTQLQAREKLCQWRHCSYIGRN